MTKAQTLRNQSENELKALYQELSQEIFQCRNEMKIARKMEKPHLVRKKKKERARVMTILREKEIASVS